MHGDEILIGLKQLFGMDLVCSDISMGDWEERLLLMRILPVLWLTMTEYGYLANPTIEIGV